MAGASSRRGVGRGSGGRPPSARPPPARLRAAPPEAPVERRDHERDGADESADAERDRDDAAPARRHRVEATDAGKERDPAYDAEHDRADDEEREPLVLEPPARDLVPDGGLGRWWSCPSSTSGRPRSGRGSGRGAPGPSATIASTTSATGASNASTGASTSASELEVGDVLRLQATPHLLLGRYRLAHVAAAADQVEEGRRELERPWRTALGEQRGDERGCVPGGRLLLVLAVAVVRCSRPSRHQTNPISASARRGRARAGSRSCAAGCRAFVDLAPVALYAAASSSSSATILSSPGPLSTFIPAVEVKNRRGTSTRSSTN